MLSQEGADHLQHQIHSLWVEPELARRKAADQLSEAFRIERALVLLPIDRPPIVQFNEEVRWEGRAKISPGNSVAVGQHIRLHEIERFEGVAPPQIDGNRVAFVYLFRDGEFLSIAFDFSPNLPDFVPAQEKDLNDETSRLIAKSLNQVLVKNAVGHADALQAELSKIGLWPVPSLLPFPLSQITYLVQQGDPQGAIDFLNDWCTSERLEALTTKWWANDHYTSRRQLLVDALWAHKQGKFTLSVSAMVPAVEGIISDWIYPQLPASNKPWRIESKVKKFREILLDRPATTYSYKRVIELAMKFVIDGPMLETFKQWTDEIPREFPNRHVVGHGRFDPTIYSKANSIKIILLLDTIYLLIHGRGNESLWLDLAPAPASQGAVASAIQ